MATVTKPIALDETFNTTEVTPRNTADVLAQELSAIATAIGNQQSAGHIIENPAGGIMTQRDGLQFVDSHLTDDSGNNRTQVETLKPVTSAAFETETEDGFYYLTDATESILRFIKGGTKVLPVDLSSIKSAINLKEHLDVVANSTTLETLIGSVADNYVHNFFCAQLGSANLPSDFPNNAEYNYIQIQRVNSTLIAIRLVAQTGGSPIVWQGYRINGSYSWSGITRKPKVSRYAKSNVVFTRDSYYNAYGILVQKVKIADCTLRNGDAFDFTNYNYFLLDAHAQNSDTDSIIRGTGSCGVYRINDTNIELVYNVPYAATYECWFTVLAIPKV